MNIAVVCANGRVGKIVVRRALGQGHQVQAFVHSHNPFDRQEQLSVLTGGVADAGAVDSAGGRADAVIRTLGAFGRGTGPVLAPGLRTITQGMDHHGTRQLVVLTARTLHTRPPPPRSTHPDQPGNPHLDGPHRRRRVDNALDTMAATDLVWTTVCAPSITTDGPDGYLLTEQMPSRLAQVSGPAAAGLVELAGHPTLTSPIVGIKQAPART